MEHPVLLIDVRKTFMREKYLQILSNDILWNNLRAFRLVSHRVEIEMGRQNNIHREQRFCQVCNMQQPESEYHILLICPTYHGLGITFLPCYCTVSIG